MKYIAFLLSIIALALSYLAYERTEQLAALKPLAQVVTGAQEKKTAIKEKAARLLDDLSQELRK